MPILLLLAFMILAMPLSAAEPWEEGLELVTHHSERLQADKQFYIYIPPTRDPEERFPVLYVLHGKTGGHPDWPKQADAAKLARNYRMILVFPDGGTNSWYLDSPIMAESQMESYITRELPDYVDANYPTVADREGRAIMGLSMGGHGALLIAAKHPDRFCSASSLSGILKLTNHPTREDVVARLGSMEEFPERWAENSVWDQAESFRDANVRILFDCGEDDTRTGAIQDSRQLHERLNELEIPHLWREHRGTHSWKYWTDHLGEHLNFHQASMIEKTPMGKWETHYFNRLRTFIDENIAFRAEAPDTRTRIALVGSSGIEALKSSLFEDWKDYRVFNRGIASDRLGIGPRGITKRMEESVFDFDPQVFVIKNGLNDLGERSRSDNGKPTEDRMVEEYAKILDEVIDRQSDAKIIVCACGPTTGRYAKLSPLSASFNKRLEQLCAERNLEYLDIFTPLADEDGLLREEFSRDGLHMTPAGNDLWLKALNGALLQE